MRSSPRPAARITPPGGRGGVPRRRARQPGRAWPDGARGAGPGRAEPSGEADGRQPPSWYADSAYGTGDLRDAIGQAGDAAVIKPKPLAPAVEGGFTLDDFTVSEDDGTVTCPNGITRRITARRNVTFGAACRGCPLRARCTTSKTGRALILHEHDDLLRAARRDWPGLREDYMTHRPNVERAVAQVATFRGRRRSCATGDKPRTTPGSSAAPPHSTCAT